MKIVFMGTPDFAVPSLQGLIDDGHEILAVYTQPDKPVGRYGAVPHLGGLVDRQAVFQRQCLDRRWGQYLLAAHRLIGLGVDRRGTL